MLASQASTKVGMQDLDSILPLQHLFGNIVGGVYVSANAFEQATLSSMN